jgi:hypothetical protein
MTIHLLHVVAKELASDVEDSLSTGGQETKNQGKLG